jgi:hypothetical protein
MRDKIKNFFKNMAFWDVMSETDLDIETPIQNFICAIPDIKEYDDDDVKYSLYKHLLVTGGIKLPNNWKTFIEAYPQPKKPDYKKVGFKYVDAFMLIRDMKGDKLKRVLHTISSYNATSYELAIKLFGEKFIIGRPDNELKLIFENKTYFGEWHTKTEFTESELKNMYRIYLEACLGNTDFSTIIDHEIPRYFINKIDDINSIIGHQQLETIDQIINILKNKNKDDKIELIKKADVFIENFSPATMDTFGFSDEKLKEINPQLIRCHITGFGPDGPYSERPAYDAIAQALSGISSLYLSAEDSQITGPTISDNVTAHYACQGILAALYERTKTNLGRRLDVNMLESSLAFIPDPFAYLTQLKLVSDPLLRAKTSVHCAKT